jgi:hypothetical protein
MLSAAISKIMAKNMLNGASHKASRLVVAVIATWVAVNSTIDSKQAMATNMLGAKNTTIKGASINSTKLIV